MKTSLFPLWFAAFGLAFVQPTDLLRAAQVEIASTARSARAGKLIAQTHNSGFALAHDTYNGMLAASGGRIYYVLSSESIDGGAKMYAYDPRDNAVRYLGDLTEACGEAGLKAIPQGKSHVNFVESGGKLYFATHVGYYSIIDGMEKIGIPPPGYRPYPGGHFLSYDLATDQYRGTRHCAAWRGHYHHEHGHPARPPVRDHVAQRIRPSAGLGQAGLEEPWQVFPGRRKRQRSSLPHSLPFVGGRFGRWLGLLQHRRRRHSALSCR